MTPYWSDEHLTLYGGDCREVLSQLPVESVNTVVTSPPYWGLRDYGVGGQLGLEPTPDEYVANMVAVFREMRRVLRDDGTLWLNLGDSYASDAKGSGGPSAKQTSNRGSRYEPKKLDHGLKHKDLVGIPWRVAFALQADGWYLRSDIIWAKPNPMPESVTDRPTKAHEYLFLMSKSARYFYDAAAVRERAVGINEHDLTGTGYEAPGQPPQNGNRQRNVGWRTDGFARPPGGQRELAERGLAGRNLRSVWTVATEPYPGAHFATFPRKLVEPCIKAGSPAGGVVLDPFAGSGTTLLVAQALGRRGVGIDLNPDYLQQAIERNRQMPLGLDGAA